MGMTDVHDESGAPARLSKLQPVGQTPTRELVADALRRAIHMGLYAPGERLPSERQLAAQLEVARGNVRAAIRALGDEGLLATTHGRSGGSTVTERPDPERGDAVTERYLARLHESYEFRLLIEPAAAALAAERADAGERDELLALASAPYAGVEDHRESDARFHLAIARASRNEHLVESISETRESFFRWAVVLWGPEYVPFEEVTRISAAQHAQIAEAIVAGDADRAREAMVEHLRFHDTRFGDLDLGAKHELRQTGAVELAR